MRDYLSQRTQVEKFVEQPIAQHIALISTYVNAWREYLVHHEEELLTLVFNPKLFHSFNTMLISVWLCRQCQSWETNPSNQQL